MRLCGDWDRAVQVLHLRLVIQGRRCALLDLNSLRMLRSQCGQLLPNRGAKGAILLAHKFAFLVLAIHEISQAAAWSPYSPASHSHLRVMHSDLAEVLARLHLVHRCVVGAEWPGSVREMGRSCQQEMLRDFNGSD